MTYKIFLASTNKLTPERQAIEIMLNRMNHDFFKKGTHLELVLWENIDPEVSAGRKQEHYNEKLKECSILILLYWGELGKFTHEEYEMAYQLLKDKKIKKIFVFEKTAPVDFKQNPENVANLNYLKEIFNEPDRQFWPVPYENVDTVKNELEHWIMKAFTDENNPDFTFQQTKLLSLNSPSDPEFFLGREDELVEIRKRLEKGGKLMLINSEGGIGKTTLAAKYWHESLNTYKHAAWCFCEGGIIKSLLELAPQLNVDLSGYTTEDDQIKALKRALHEIQHDFLLVLDNANDEDDILAFKKEFEGFQWHVLMTSRCQGVLDDDFELPIIHLPPPLAKALFLKYYPINIDDIESERKIDQILNALDYHTLAVEIFAKNMKEAQGITTIDEFLEKLENQGLFLGDDSFEIKTDYAQKHLKSRKATSDEILNALYDFSFLEKNDELKKLTINLGVLPAIDFGIELLFTLMTDETKNEKIKLRQNLITLNKNGWVTKTNERYRMSPVVQELVLTNNRDIVTNESEGLIDNILKRLQNDCIEFNTDLTIVSKYINYYKRFAKVIKPETGKSTHYTYCCLLYYRIIGDYNLYKVCIDTFYKQSSILHDAKPEKTDYENNIGICYEQYGNYYHIIGDKENTVKSFEKYVKISKSIATKFKNISDYKLNWTISLSRLAKIYFEYNDIENAFKCQTKRLNLIRQLVDEHPEKLNYIQNLASTFSSFGKLEEENGNLEKALDYFNQQLSLFTELNAKKPEYVYYKVGIATAYQDIGSVLFSQSEYSESLDWFKKYNVLSQELVNKHPLQVDLKKGLVTSIINLAEAYFKLNNHQQGFEYIIQAYELYIQLNEATQWQNIDYVYNFSQVCKMIFVEYSKLKAMNFKDNVITSLDKLGYTYEEIKKINDRGNTLYNNLKNENKISQYVLNKF